MHYFTLASCQVKSVEEVSGAATAEFITKNSELIKKAEASQENAAVFTTQNQAKQKDLLYVTSVLVSAGANKNDDVFLREELIAAAATPVNKPDDWEHDSQNIIGHMIESFLVNEDGNIVEASQHPMSGQLDLVVKSVVYSWLFPDRAREIVSGSKDGTLAVSMEAWFEGYDYQVGDKVIARNDQTKFLDAHLRVHGGDGLYKDKAVKRVLRKITFGGKGYVKRPANPRSVIQDVASLSQEPILISQSSSAGTLTFTQPTIFLPTVWFAPVKGGVENIEMIKPTEDATMDLKELQAKLEAAEKKIAEFEKADSAKALEAMKAEVTSRDEKIKSLEAKVAESTKQLEAHKDCEANTKALQEKLSKAEEAITQIVRKGNISKRMAELAKEFGLAAEGNDDIRDTVADLTDDEFKAYVEDRKKFVKSAEKLQTPPVPTPAPKPEDVLKNAAPVAEVVPAATDQNDEKDAVAKEVAAALGFANSEEE